MCVNVACIMWLNSSTLCCWLLREPEKGETICAYFSPFYHVPVKHGKLKQSVLSTKKPTNPQTLVQSRGLPTTVWGDVASLWAKPGLAEPHVRERAEGEGFAQMGGSSILF